MTVNYHTHTIRCGHAAGADEEYIRAAIQRGIKTLGFSDHTPHPGGERNGVRMGMDMAEEYFSSLLELREKYKSEIDIKIGFETEYYPLIWDKLLEDYKRLPIDFLILGLHSVPDYPPVPDEENRIFGVKDRSSFFATDSPEVLRGYVDLITAGMRTGVFSCVAHPDVINFVGEREVYRREMSRIIELSVELSIPLELNVNGVKKGLLLGDVRRSHYPNPDFWRLAAEKSASAIIGIDAHTPRDITDAECYAETVKFAKECGIKLLDDMPLVKPIFG